MNRLSGWESKMVKPFKRQVVLRCTFRLKKFYIKTQMKTPVWSLCWIKVKKIKPFWANRLPVTPVSPHGTVCHCDVLKIEQAGSAAGLLFREENPLLCRGRATQESQGLISLRSTTEYPGFLGVFSSLDCFYIVSFDRHGLRGYFKAVDGVWGPPQSPVSQAEKVQSTTGDSQHSVATKMQPPSPGRQSYTFDVSLSHRRWTPSHPR